MQTGLTADIVRDEDGTYEYEYKQEATQKSLGLQELLKRIS